MPFSTRPQDTGGPMSLRSDEQMLGIILARRLSSALEGFLYFRSSFVEKLGEMSTLRTPVGHSPHTGKGTAEGASNSV